MTVNGVSLERSRRYLVVGAVRGIGQAVVARLLADGCACVATSRQPEHASHVDGAASAGLWFVQGDPRNRDDVHRFMQQAVQLLGGLDGVVYCAGTAAVGPLAQLTPADIDEVLDVNVKGVLYTAQEALPHLRESPDPCIVVISSQAAHRGQSLISVYTASKGAVEALVRSLAVELAAEVRVNAVAPGIVLTDMIREDFRRQAALESVPELAVEVRTRERIPLRRFQARESIAAAVAYLLSPDGRDVTGQVLRVDGGMSA
jgi:meso-butanediol dehydrogenase / (S,S)-butanediol dehydrogenase / diacetyl reductase